MALAIMILVISDEIVIETNAFARCIFVGVL